MPFRHQGRTRQGVDCVGLPIVVLEGLGVLPRAFREVGYSRLPTGELMAHVMSWCRPLEVVQPGALLILAWNVNPAHAGIATGENIVHAYERVGKVVEHGFRAHWPSRLHSVWALPGVAYE